MTEHEHAKANLAHRIEQMSALIRFRPYWLHRGPCTNGETVMSMAVDGLACPCEFANYDCSVYSLTKTEMLRLPHPPHRETFPA